jgi:hypothetical protein
MVPDLDASHYPASQSDSQFWGLFESFSTTEDSQDPPVAAHGGHYPDSTNHLAFIGDVGEPPVGGSYVAPNHSGFPWQQSQRVPPTIINDGNFIAAGNVNNIAGDVNNIYGESGKRVAAVITVF